MTNKRRNKGGFLYFLTNKINTNKIEKIPLFPPFSPGFHLLGRQECENFIKLYFRKIGVSSCSGGVSLFSYFQMKTFIYKNVYIFFYLFFYIASGEMKV